MSNQVNDNIRERAKEMAEECTNTMYGDQLNSAIERDDLEDMARLVFEASNYLASVE